jgi:homocysteine S-methyltransferase
MPNSLPQALRDRVVIFDGGMGTEIYKRNFFVNTCFDDLCLTAPQIIGEIHRAYAEAGAEVLTANSFGANANKLGKFGLRDKMAAINAAAVRLAREAGSAGTLVAGSVGPIGEIPFDGRITDAKIVDLLAEQAAALTAAGADFLVFETLPSAADAEFAAAAAGAIPDIPYVLSFSIDRNGESAKGEDLSTLLAVATAAARPPAAIGLNCGVGPEGILAGLEKLMALTNLPVVVQPNAGIPKSVDGRFIYMASPEYMATYALRFVQMGARGIGGCCGTTPDHIRDLARSIRPLAGKAFASAALRIDVRAGDLRPPAPPAEKSRLGAKLASGAWVATVEIVPPRGFDLASTVAKARQCRDVGVDAINIPDGPRASARLSPLVSAATIQREADIECILHFCCRDRNLIGMQSDLLGCAAAGIHNLLFITGDPPKLGDYPFASAVFDADSIGMARIQDRLNRGVDLGGHPRPDRRRRRSQRPRPRPRTSPHPRKGRGRRRVHHHPARLRRRAPPPLPRPDRRPEDPRPRRHLAPRQLSQRRIHAQRGSRRRRPRRGHEPHGPR